MKRDGWDSIETESLNHILELQDRANERATENYGFFFSLAQYSEEHKY